MKHWLRQFRLNESGAVTVDWMVLTAAVVGLAIGIVTLLRDAITDPATGIGATIASAASIEYDFDL